MKANSDESPLFFAIRKLYYELVSRLAEIELNKNATGFGLYDRRFIDILAEIDDPYPYFRGLVSEIGFPVAKIPYHQPVRTARHHQQQFLPPLRHGDARHHQPFEGAAAARHHARLRRVVSQPARRRSATSSSSCFTGTASSSASRRWRSGLFFFGSVQLFFIGILGEYIGAIHTQVQKRPHVVELERINFEPEPASLKSSMKVVILCGGLGTRLREETEFRPKPMVPDRQPPDPLAHHEILRPLRLQGIRALPRLQGAR